MARKRLAAGSALPRTLQTMQPAVPAGAQIAHLMTCVTRCAAIYANIACVGVAGDVASVL